MSAPHLKGLLVWSLMLLFLLILLFLSASK